MPEMETVTEGGGSASHYLKKQCLCSDAQGRANGTSVFGGAMFHIGLCVACSPVVFPHSAGGKGGSVSLWEVAATS